MAVKQLRRVVPLVAVLVAAVLVAAWAFGDDGREHRLVAVVDEANNLIPGQELRAGGGPIGSIESVDPIERGARARLTFLIDDKAWPLAKGTKFDVRWGGTATYYNKRITVMPAPDDGPKLREGQVIPSRDVSVPVEVDQLLATFDEDTRRDLKSFINRSGATFDKARTPFRRVLTKTPQALDEATAVLKDLTADEGALSQTLRRTDSVVDSIRRADPGVSTLITGAATTFEAIAAEQQGLRGTLAALPGTLQQTRATLAKAEGTLGKAGRLATRIRPGIRQLRAVAGPLDRVLANVQDIAPDANRTLRTVRTNGDDITTLLDRVTQVSPQLGSIGDKAVENLKCIRPYAPEITGLAMTWADFLSWQDGKDKILRAQVQNFLPAQYNNVPLTPAQAASVYEAMRYGFPRPPGTLAGQPWFLEECGAGRDALDPTKDPEADVPPRDYTEPPENEGRG